ncbi:DinB family protein [Symmachiella dynata]|uniref:DinB family protein n=1 Tax=Symmachiella dynata TaxID=2527995 RepID=UPI0030EBB571
MLYTNLLNEYAAAPEILRETVAGMTAEQLDAVPIPGKWSTRQVICHIADFETVYADRMKRVIAESEPTFFGGDPDTFAAHLAYGQREVGNEIQLIESVRGQMTRILRTLSSKDFRREGIHSENGQVSLGLLLEGITEHIPHHLHFIKEKQKALKL